MQNSVNYFRQKNNHFTDKWSRTYPSLSCPNF